MNRAMGDPSCDPGTNILRNIPDIRDRDALAFFETDAVAANLILLRRKPVKRPFDIARLCEGNRRTLRAFTSDLAQVAGFPLDWARVRLSEQDRQALYHARDIAAMRGDLKELTEIMGRCLSQI